MTTIKINDEWLLYALKNEVGKTLTKKKLADITYLDWSEYRDEAGETWEPIGDIQGLEYCINLEVLSFDGNSVTDLSPLSGLKKLKEIWLVGNSVEDVSPISKLPNLEKLVLDLNSSLKDISPLSSLPSIKYINISSTSVRDITPLQNLNTLEELSLYIDNLDLSPGSKNREVLINLINKGVKVNNRKIEELTKEAASKIKLKKSASFEDKLRAQGAFNITKIIVNKGINGIDGERGNTPLHMALENYFILKENLIDQTAVVQLLIENKADLNSKNKNGHTPLSYYLNNNKDAELKIVKILIDNGADVNLSYGYTNPPIYYAIKENRTDIINLLIESGASVNEPIIFNALCQHGYIDIVERLLKDGYKTNQKEKNFGRTPLFSGVEGNQIEVIQILLNYDADVNFKDELGATPLLVANNKEVLKILLENGADIDAVDEYGQNALFGLLIGERYECIKYLLEKGIQVNIKDKYGNTPLHRIHYDSYNPQESLDIINLLVKYGADVNARNNENKTPLDLLQNPSMIKRLNFLMKKKKKQKKKQKKTKKKKK